LKELLTNTKEIFRKIHYLSYPFWVSEVKKKAYILFGLLVALICLSTYSYYIYTEAYGNWQNNLQGKNTTIYYESLKILVFMIFFWMSSFIVTYFVQSYLAIVWREWMTSHFINRYFQNRAYYDLQQRRSIDNPDQRIAEDIRSFVEKTVDLFRSILDSILTSFSFFYLLFTISQFLFYTSFGVAAFITILSVFVFGRKLANLNIDQYKKEANFRYNIMRTRENAESIAFFKGEKKERTSAITFLKKVIENKIKILHYSSGLIYFQLITNFLVSSLPYIVVAEDYFIGKVDYGTIGRSALAFGNIIGSLIILATQLEKITLFIADITRLSELDSIFTSENTNESKVKVIQSDSFRIQNLSLKTYDGKKELFQNLNLELKGKENLLITGRSGIGKSSLLRAFAGLWDLGGGNIFLPDNKGIFFIPQKPYLPIASLKEILVYPNDSEERETDFLLILEKVNLGYLARSNSIDTILDYSHILSLGEQQRVAFARLLLSGNKFAILDEATSALDSANEDAMYSILKQEGIQFISVGHRDSIRKFHDIELHLENASDWEKRNI